MCSQGSSTNLPEKISGKKLESDANITGISCQQWRQNQYICELRIWGNNTPEQQGQ